MIPGVDEDVDRICRNIAAAIVAGLLAYAFGMWLMRGVVVPEMFLASGLGTIAMVVDFIVARRHAAA